MPSLPLPQSRRRPRLEIIPFIDIMFFLLATFMMVSLSMVRNEGVPVRLPTATTSSPQDRTEIVSITVTSTGDLFYDQEPVNRDMLASRLRSLKASKSDPKIFINGDAKSSFENIVSVLDEVRKAGISKIAIETKKK